MNKQHEVAKYLQTVESATLDEIYKNVPFGYYCNGHKHLGDMLARMIRVNKVVRVKKGHYRLATIEDLRMKHVENTIQFGLFE